MGVADAAAWAEHVVMMPAPDELQAHEISEEQALKPNMKRGSALFFAHGLNVHFGQSSLRAGEITGDRPEGPGHTVRARYKQRRRAMRIIAIAQDATENTHDRYRCPCRQRSAGRAGIIETTFPRGMRTNLTHDEQAVLAGGLVG